MGKGPLAIDIWRRHSVMEQHDPSQRQYAPNPYAQQPQRASGQLSGQYATQTSNDSLRQQVYLQHSPTAPSSAGRASNDAQQMYGFAQSAQYGALPALQASAMPYAQSIPTQEPQRRIQEPSYQSYDSNIMYGMTPSQPQQQQTGSVYDQIAQYRQRPSAASETLPTQFGDAQTAQFYLAGQAGPTSAPMPELTAQQPPSLYQQTSYPQTGLSVPQPYPGTIIDPSQSGAYGTYTQQQQPQYGNQQQQAHTMDQDFDDYQARVRTIFTLVRDGTLRDVAQHLQHISQYLLGQCEALGLTRDDESLHDDRIRLWDEFNCAWLTTMQRQFDMTKEIVRTGQHVREPQSIMSSHTLEQLSRDLVRLCDQVEKHGLVDYQMGVLEEEIMDLILRCLSFLDPKGERTGEAVPQAESSSAAAARHR